MKLELTGINETPRGIEFWFKEPVHNQRDFNTLGRRAYRIMRLIAPNTPIVISGAREHCFLLLHNKPLGTQKSVQQLMDKHANTKPALRFKEASVFIPGKKLKTIEQVRDLRGKGKDVKLLLVFLLNLPAVDEDYKKLSTAVSNYSATVSCLSDDSKQIGVEVTLNAQLANKDPWELIEEIKPKVLRVTLN